MSPRPKILAHRGLSRVAPENTIPAFRAGMERHVDGFELDVQFTKDQRMVVIHDFQVGRTVRRRRAERARADEPEPRIRDLTRAELDEYEAGSFFQADFAGTPVPDLEQVLDLVGDQVLLNLEVKSLDLDGHEPLELLVDLLRSRQLMKQVIVSSFNPIVLMKLRWLDPGIPLGLIFRRNLPAYLERAWLSPLIAPEALHPHISLVDYDFVQRAHDQGYMVNVWTVNEPEDARRLAAWGVDAIVTDDPELIRRALDDA